MINILDGAEDWIWLVIPAIGACVFWRLFSCACYCQKHKDSMVVRLPTHDAEAPTVEYHKIEWIEQTPPEIQEAMMDREWLRSLSATAVIPPIRLSR